MGALTPILPAPSQIAIGSFSSRRSQHHPLPHPVKVCCIKNAEADHIDVARKKNLPPGPMKLPLVGNLLNLAMAGSTLPHHALRNLAEEYGPLMHLQLGEVPAVVVTSPKMAEKVFKTHDSVFSQRPEVLASKILAYDSTDIVFAPDGQYWRQMRKAAMTEMLGPKRVKSWFPIRAEECSDLVESIRASAGTPIDFTKKIFLLTSNVTARAAFGNKSKDQDKVVNLIKEAVLLAGGFDLADLFPSIEFLHVITGTKPKLEKLHKQVDEILDDFIREHKEKLVRNTRGRTGKSEEEEEEEEEEDILDVLLRLQQSGSLGCPFAMKNIKAVIWDMFAAGTDTSSTTAEWAMSEMMRNPRVLAKAQAEVRQAFRGKKTICDADIEELHYLKLVIKETLRLHPPVPLLVPRESNADCEIDGYEIPAKTKLIVNAWAIGRDPGYWEEPESFIPERFADNPIDYKGMNFEYIPFGSGRRICPGIGFGLANVDYPLAQLLYHFDWKLPGGRVEEDLDMTENFGVTAGRKNSLYLVATPYIPANSHSSHGVEAMEALRSASQSS